MNPCTWLENRGNLGRGDAESPLSACIMEGNFKTSPYRCKLSFLLNLFVAQCFSQNCNMPQPLPHPAKKFKEIPSQSHSPSKGARCSTQLWAHRSTLPAFNVEAFLLSASNRAFRASSRDAAAVGLAAAGTGRETFDSTAFSSSPSSSHCFACISTGLF